MPQTDQKNRHAENNRDAREVFGRRLTPVIVLLSLIVASVAAALYYVALTVQQETGSQFARQQVRATVQGATERLRQRAKEFDRLQLTQAGLDESVSSSGFLSVAQLIEGGNWETSPNSAGEDLNPIDMSRLLAGAREPNKPESPPSQAGESIGFVRGGSTLHLAIVRRLDKKGDAAASDIIMPRALALSVDVQTLLAAAQSDDGPMYNFRVIGSQTTPEELAVKSGLPLRSVTGEIVGIAAWDTRLAGPDQAKMLVVPLTLCLFVIVVAGSAIVVRVRRSRDEALRWASEMARTSEEIADREAQAQEAKRVAEVANHAKTEFLANMSHELRTPLNAVIGFSELIAEEVMGPVGSEVYKEYSRDIRASGEHLLEIINEILDLSKIEAGRMTLDEQAFAVERVVASSLRLVRERANANGIALTSEVAPAMPDLRGDERMIRQMMTNFLSNAVKFTPENGKVHVRARCLDDGSIEISVSDTGIGMSPEHMETAMLPFRQVSSSLARKHEGTGLGLPLAKAFIDLHGGKLDVDSELEVGTTVRVTFPAARSIPKR